MEKYYLIIGGHHSSAIPLINILIKNKGSKIKFIGHKYASVLNNYKSSEYKEITSLKIPYIDLKSPKFYKVPGFSKYIKLIQSILFCINLFIKDRPYLIISYGGYLAVPVVIAGRILGIKCVTHEQTYTEGLATKLIAKMCIKVYVSWKENLKIDKKYVFVGLPLRNEIKLVPIKNLTRSYAFKTIFIQGGKQGSHFLNEFVFNNIDKLTKQYEIYHQTSRHSINNDYLYAKRLSKKYSNYHAFDFIFGPEYSKILQESDVVLSRSGAHIVYEMAYLKMPCIFVPIPWASQNEQNLNAIVAKNYTPTIIVSENDFSISSFNSSIFELKNIINKSVTYKNVEDNSAHILAKEISKL